MFVLNKAEERDYHQGIYRQGFFTMYILQFQMTDKNITPIIINKFL